MNKSPLVSIIIPVYNGSNYLSEAINSALAQTYLNIEVLVINDGSNDNGSTRDIALSYGDKIRYFEKENGGVASALNCGIRNMQGEYFSWLSHDDLYEPNKLQFQLDLYKKGIVQNDTILYSNYTLINATGKTPYKVILDQALLKFKRLYALYRGCLNGCTLLIPKNILDNLGEFNEKLRYTQDYDLWFRASEKFSFYHIPQFLVKTRIHKKQDSRNKNTEADKEANLLWINMVKNISEKNLTLLEETPLKFYHGMFEFISHTPYHEAKEYYEHRFSRQ
jgi:glycosyltransferase involved in cell wall biosynthesis